MHRLFKRLLFSCVLKGSEFNHINIIAGSLQLQSSKAVGQQLGELVLDDSMFQHRLMERVFYLREKLMLAARHT